MPDACAAARSRTHEVGEPAIVAAARRPAAGGAVAQRAPRLAPVVALVMVSLGGCGSGADTGPRVDAGQRADAYTEAVCGNGTVEPGEQCDEGAANGTSWSCCSATCQYVTCGPGACTPSCADRACGPDGCGGSCGGCGSDSCAGTCNAAGACEPPACGASDGCCPGGCAAGQDADCSARPAGSLQIDPGFSAAQLTGALSTWYARLWAAINNPNQYLNANDAATSNDTYRYGRTLNAHVTALLHVFRMSGDAALLAEIDRLAELMRAELRDWSILERGGRTYAADGYLNWLWLNPGDPQYVGTDVHEMDDILTHSLVAAFAYAFHENRAVAPYGDHATFWVDYLKNHFEAKWRARENKPTGPFMDKYLTHAYTQWIRYHHYMYLLTGETWYHDEALRKAGVVEVQMVSVKADTAFVWDHHTRADPGSGATSSMCQPFTYGRYTVQAAADLALAGMSVFADPGFMGQLAGTVRENIIDNGATDFAPDVCGGVALGGLPASGYDRGSRDTWAISDYGEVGRWDPTGTVADTAAAVYNASESGHLENPRRIHIPAGMVLSLWP